MSIFKNIKVKLPSELYESRPIVPHGTCGDCGEVAMDVVARVCNTCAPYYGVNTFPYYAYPSELMFKETKHRELRMFFFHNVYGL